MKVPGPNGQMDNLETRSPKPCFAMIVRVLLTAIAVRIIVIMVLSLMNM
jgi:hypothetical protein